jgi:hypothetical protein
LQRGRGGWREGVAAHVEDHVRLAPVFQRLFLARVVELAAGFDLDHHLLLSRRLEHVGAEVEYLLPHHRVRRHLEDDRARRYPHAPLPARRFVGVEQHDVLATHGEQVLVHLHALGLVQAAEGVLLGPEEEAFGPGPTLAEAQGGADPLVQVLGDFLLVEHPFGRDVVVGVHLRAGDGDGADADRTGGAFVERAAAGHAD